MPRPASTEYAPYFEKYLALVPEEDILGALESQIGDTVSLLRGVSEEQANTRHPPYTWSVKEVVGHLMDGERIFGYRALRFARGDATPLPGFDEKEYASVAQFDRCRLGDLLSEFEAVRRSNVWLFRNLPPEAWPRSGVAFNNSVSVRALAYILVGHARHHTGILKKRLGKG